MYTIKQIKELGDKVAVMLHDESQWETLKKLGLSMTSQWYTASLYSVNTYTWGNETSIKNPACYSSRTLLDFSEIDFEEQYTPQIFN